MLDTAESKRAFHEGVRDILPSALGVCVWGLVTGVAMAQSGLALQHALTLSAIAFAGSAQVATLPLLAGAAPVWLIVLTALLVNLRFVIYSVNVASSFAHLRPRRRLLLGYLTGDISYAFYVRRLQRDPQWRERDVYYLGLSVSNFIAWHLGALTGILGAAAIPRGWGLEFAGALVLLVLLVPAMKVPATAAGIVTASATSLMTWHWPYRLGLVAAIVAGVSAALAVAGWRERAR